MWLAGTTFVPFQKAEPSQQLFGLHSGPRCDRKLSGCLLSRLIIDYDCLSKLNEQWGISDHHEYDGPAVGPST